MKRIFFRNSAVYRCPVRVGSKTGTETPPGGHKTGDIKGKQRMNNGRVSKRVLGVVLAAAALLMYVSIFFKVAGG